MPSSLEGAKELHEHDCCRNGDSENIPFAKTLERRNPLLMVVEGIQYERLHDCR